MIAPVKSGDAPLAIDRARLDAVFSSRGRYGYTFVDSTVCDGAIVLEEIDSTPRRRAGPDAGRAPSL
jgi:hypothetical protein